MVVKLHTVVGIKSGMQQDISSKLSFFANRRRSIQARDVPMPCVQSAVSTNTDVNMPT